MSERRDMFAAAALTALLSRFSELVGGEIARIAMERGGNTNDFFNAAIGAASGEGLRDQATVRVLKNQTAVAWAIADAMMSDEPAEGGG